MVDRIFVGKKDGNQLLRISKQGFDVNDRANPMVFSSDNDYLRVHHRGRLRLDRHITQVWHYFTGKSNFPTLSYYPFVWWKSTNNGRGLDQAYKFPSAAYGDDNYVYMDCVVGKSSVWFSGRTLADFQFQVDIDYIVFENRMY